MNVSRRERNLGLDEKQYLRQHDDDLDDHDKLMAQINSKLDRMLWIGTTMIVSSSTAIAVWAIQIAARRP